MLDLRTEEEMQDEENEVRRLERFFGVEELPEADYVNEWAAKEEALSQIVDKLFRAQAFAGALAPGAHSAEAEADGAFEPARPQAVGRKKDADFVAEVGSLEVSYVLPPAVLADDEISLSTDAGGPRRWAPRLVVAHRDGGIMLVSLGFEHVARGKDRDERWACTALRAELVASASGEPVVEPTIDIRGPAPHGVRYMRI